MPTAPARVLLVDDDEGLLRLQQQRLERHGYVVLVASTAVRALQILTGDPVDVVVLDQNLGAGDTGLDIYRTSRTQGVSTPAILATGFGGEQVVVEALRAGVRDFLYKAVDYLDLLIPAVDRLVREVRALRELSEARERLVREQAQREEMQRSASEKDALLAQADQARQEAERANQVKDEFLATLSHELRTPLNAMLGWTSLLRMPGGSPELVAKATEAIERNVKIQTGLVEDILDTSKIVVGKLRVELEPLAPGPIVQAAVDIVRPAADAKHIVLETVLSDSVALIMADAGRLQQVVWNLLSNAVKFTPAGGQVRIDLSGRADLIEIRVTDSGCGIAADFLPYVFDRFRQGDGGRSRQHGGLGLGLALVWYLVEAHGGTVTASSEGEGRGATFRVCLPRLESGHATARS